MVNKYNIFLLSLILIITFGCDKIEKPFMEDTSGKCGTDILSVTIRKVLVEDYTGHTCGNCPRAAETIDTLKSIYCDHIVAIAVHAGFFAEPKNYPDSSYYYDFRTETGNELDAHFGNSSAGLPNGMVNRKEIDGTTILPDASWGSIVDQLLFDETGYPIPPDIGIKITNTYNAATRTLKTSIESGFISSMEGTFKLSVYLVEDSIINWQKDYYNYPPPGINIPDYLHLHVLRGAINSTWGEIIATGLVSSGSAFTKEYTKVLDPEWVAEHCSVVAFVYDAADYEVIQAEEVEVIE